MGLLALEELPLDFDTGEHVLLHLLLGLCVLGGWRAVCAGGQGAIDAVVDDFQRWRFEAAAGNVGIPVGAAM